MATEEELRLRVEADTADAKRDLQALGEAAEDIGPIEIDVEARTVPQVRDTLEDVVDILDEVESKSASVAQQMIADANKEDAALRQAGAAAEALTTALGESADKFDVDRAVGELHRLGLGFDEIEADAEQLAAALRRVDDIQLRRVSDGITTTRRSMGELRDSSDQSRSVLANLAGNAAQDLGELGGVVGTLGVGVGQLAEYAVDGNIALSNLAKVAGPMLALSAALAAVNKIMAETAKVKAFDAERVKTFTDAVRENGDVWAALRDQITETGQLAFSADGPFGGAFFGRVSDVIPKLQELGLTFQDFQRLVTDQSALQALIDYRESLDPTKYADTRSAILDVINAVDDYRGSIEDVTQSEQELDEFLGRVPVTLDEVNDALGRMKNPLETNTEIFRKLIDDAKDGRFDFEASAEAIEMIAAATGRSTDEIVRMVQAQASKELEATSEAADAAAESLGEFHEQVRLINFDPMRNEWTPQFQALVDDIKDGTIDLEFFDLNVQALADHWGMTADQVREYILAEANNQLEAEAEAAKEAAGAIDEYGNALARLDVAAARAKLRELLDAEPPDLAGPLEEELNEVDAVIAGLEFDVNWDTKFRDALKGLRGFEPDLQTMADHWKEILEGGNIEMFGKVGGADDIEFFTRVKPLIDLFQEGVVNEFKQGGENAANTFAQSMAASIAQATGLDIQDVYNLMGIPGGEVGVLIQPSIDAAAAAKATAILDVLAGVSGDPRIAELQLQLITGEITPEEAAAEAEELAQQYLDGNPVTMKTQVDPSGAEEGTEGFRRDTATGKPAVIPVDADPAGAEGTTKTFTDTKRSTTVDLDLATLVATELITSFVTRPRTTTITAKADVAAANFALSLLAAIPRTAHIRVQLDGLADAERQLANLTRTRHTTVVVDTRTGTKRNGSP